MWMLPTFIRCRDGVAGTQPRTTGMATIETTNLAEQNQGRFSWIDETTISQGREYASTFITQFIVMASQILVYKLASHYLGKTGFSEYALARRTVAVICPLPILGLGVALPRFIACARGHDDADRASYYLGATIWCVGCATAVCVLLMNSIPGTFSYLFFGSRDYRHLMFPLSIVIVGLSLHAVAYAYFRGQLAMRRANSLQLVNLGVVPLVAFLLVGKNVHDVLLALGWLSTGVAAAGLLFTPWRRIASDSTSEAKELLHYGLQRIPGDFILMALLTLPATLVAHLRGVQEAGFVAFGVSILTIIGTMFAPIGLILLPKASRMLAEDARSQLRSHVLAIVKITLLVSVTVTLLIEVFAGRLIRLYLGADFAEVTTMLRVAALGGVPYSLYHVLRNLIDAYHKNAVTTGILLMSMVVSCLGSIVAYLLMPNTVGILVAFLFGVFALGFLSGGESRRILTS